MAVALTPAEKRALRLSQTTHVCEHCGDPFTPVSNRQRYCKGCVPDKRARMRMSRYGISQEQYDEMVKRQAGRCPICGRMPLPERFMVDHDHTTGSVRGLLCSYCNPALNLIEHHLQAALVYLGRISTSEGRGNH